MTKIIPASETDRPRLTAAQWRMLRAVGRTGDAFSHLSGRSDRGGGVGTHVALCRHGLLDMNGLTAAGRARLVRAGDLPEETASSQVRAQLAGKGA